ncbi:urokinase-type plasminogen activator-like [Clupea harengus]|uniref:Urokinase-type plasminogen activator n=1 Tax=Clupea harengus TaxID=7950 RepID=A0A8M1KGA4_CLUHA|nr:urokinase-type plasminogen activator-like [Clupea harengus]
MQILFSLIAALILVSTTSGGLLRAKRQNVFVFTADDASTSLTSRCLHGGSPLTHEGEHLWCICPDGFSGMYCEKVSSPPLAHGNCYTGIGLYYRGTESRSRSGRKCLRWNMDPSEGLGRHKYCRNPDYSRKPWCHVKTVFGVIKEYCNIPSCLTVPGPTVQPQTSRPDTAGPSLPQPNQPGTGPTCGDRQNKLMKIVGGSVTPVESQPWQAAIYWKSSSHRTAFLCGGSLIAPCWVLTAAHCFADGQKTKANEVSVILGKSAINETDVMSEQKFDVTEVIVHEDFDNSQGSFNNDIALLKIRSETGQCARETKTVRTVCLPVANQALPSGDACEIAGYGKEKQGLWYYSQYLRTGKVELISQDVCSSKTYYGSMITDNMFCAGSPNWSTDACKGDSGGPLVCSVNDRMVLFGVISWGDGCAKAFRPGVYTRVSNYNSWIAKHMGQPSPKADTTLSRE